MKRSGMKGVALDRRVSPVLVGCEESQTICKAFREAGYEAYSCDIEPTRGNPDWHYQRDIMEVIPTRRWGLIILHPDCTKMAVSGNRWYGRGTPRHHERQQAVEWTVALWELAKQHGDRVALENPVSVIFQYLNAPVCYVQPRAWRNQENGVCFAQFGTAETDQRSGRAGTADLEDATIANAEARPEPDVSWHSAGRGAAVGHNT